jgi:sulfur relay (sulfurtransferase) DsrC/TusE family protein
MRLYDKIKWILGILMIFILIITTNLVDRNNFLRISEAIESIYEDRLVAKDLILKISNLIHEKEIASIRSDADFYLNQNGQIENDIETHIVRYNQTKLTIKEEEFLKEFRNNYSELKESEEEFIRSNYSQNPSLLNHFSEVKKNLNNLAQIQLQEGNRQLEISRSAIDTVELFTQIEIYILVFLAIVIQIIVIYNPRKE